MSTWDANYEGRRENRLGKVHPRHYLVESGSAIPVFLPKPTKEHSSVVVPCLACMQEPRVSPHILEDEECGRALTSMERVWAKFQCHRNMFNGTS